MSGLSFESMPPLFIPLRFFLTAPVFGILASILLLIYADTMFNSRWSGEILALTHLFTLGFMLMSMTGALFQFIPVITGYSIPESKKITPIIYFSLIIGTLFLVVGFLYSSALFFQLSLLFLSIGFGVFTLALSYLLITLNSEKEAVFILRLVDIALFITLALGLFMIFAYAFEQFAISFRQYTNLHLMWGLLGWTILLIMAVSSQVIPMFHVTPPFPAKYLKSLSSALILSLIFLSIIFLAGISDLVQMIAELVVSFGVLIFSFYTLYMVTKRKRKVKDITINFWRMALVMPIVAVFLYWFNDLTLKLPSTQLEILLAILFIFGLAISSIMGMVQKMVPFIIYIHLQRLTMSYMKTQPEKMGLLPNMQNLISVKNQEIQFYLHLVTLLLLVLSLFINGWAIIAALLMLLDFSWLSYNLFYSAKQYQDISKRIKA
ncbi:MAG: hypothetical protein QM504_14570 [Pseudomonadota bacterium]